MKTASAYFGAMNDMKAQLALQVSNRRPCGAIQQSMGVPCLLDAEQVPTGHEQIRQRSKNEQALAVLRQPPITHLGKAEDALNDKQCRGEIALCALVADSPAQFDAALDLVSRRYASRGYEISTRQQVLRGKSSSHPRREMTFLVGTGQTALGTLTLRLDGPEGLLAEKTHEGIIGRSRVAGCKVCELTRFAVAEKADSKVVLAALFSLAYAVGREVHDVTDVFIEVNPRHVRFYLRVFGFTVAAGEKLCERVQAPSVLLRSEVQAIGDRLRHFGYGCALKAMNATTADPRQLS